MENGVTYKQFKRLHKEAHTTWKGMKERCDNKDCPEFKNYGGRGIFYQYSWRDFLEFYKDMGDPPIDPHTGTRTTLDRIDNNLGYFKANCRWATRKEQVANKRIKTEIVIFLLLP